MRRRNKLTFLILIVCRQRWILVLPTLMRRVSFRNSLTRGWTSWSLVIHKIEFLNDFINFYKGHLAIYLHLVFQGCNMFKKGFFPNAPVIAMMTTKIYPISIFLTTRSRAKDFFCFWWVSLPLFISSESSFPAQFVFFWVLSILLSVFLIIK